MNQEKLILVLRICENYYFVFEICVFSDWYNGHGGSPYRLKDWNEKAEILNKIKPYLTYLLFHF